jgi:hypothetical protein
VSDKNKYSQIFDYFSAPVAPAESHGVLAFGRKDLLVARKIFDLSHTRFADFVVITGGIGKDSGDLAVPEAEYLAQGLSDIANAHNADLPPVFTETQARNGAENARNSLLLMERAKLDYRPGITTVAHATSARRLAAGLEHEAVTSGKPIEKIYRVPTDYKFDPANLADQEEAVAEMLRLAEWPNKNWLQPQPDLPADLVDFAQEKTKI